jgi:glycosyltransferase involved in cell wall biosynthesis
MSVDIGIPTRGRATFLREAIDSVLAQTFTDWRLVVSENGPGEEPVARAVAPYLSDPRITHRVIGRDVGAAGNHTAIARTGEAPYVAILHDDDLWDAAFLERLMEFLEVHPRCGLAFCRARYIDENGRELWRERYRAVTAGEHDPSEFARKMLHRDWVGVPSKVVVRRSAYEAVGPFHPEFLHWDYEMWTRIAARFPVGHLEEHYAAWRMHAGQTTQLEPTKAEEAIRFFAHLEDVVGSALPPGSLSRRDRGRRRSGALLTMALDALEQGARRRAFHLVARALRMYPASAADPRAATVLALAPLGARGGRAARRAREAAQRLRLRRGISVHRA